MGVLARMDKSSLKAVLQVVHAAAGVGGFVWLLLAYRRHQPQASA